MTTHGKRPIRIWFVVLCTGLGILLLVNYLFRPFSPSAFEVFRDSVSRNPNLDPAVMWARQVIADTNMQAAHFEGREHLQLESAQVAKEKLPRELALLGQGLFGGNLDAPRAMIYRDLAHTQAFVLIGYDFGREESFGLTIGQTNFAMPPWLGRKQGLIRAERCRPGVFIYETGT